MTVSSILNIKTVLFIALIIRVIYLIIYSGMPEWTQLTVDNYYHIHWAERIASGEIIGDTTYFRAPFYVFVLAGLIKLVSTSLWVFRIFGMVVGLFSITFIYLIAQRLFTKKAALLSALLYAVCPLTIYFESEILLDSFFTLLLLAFFHLLLKAIEKRNLYEYFAAGICYGLAVITRPTALVLVPAVIWLLYREKNRLGNSIYRLGTALLVGSFLLVGTIFVRNLVVEGDPVLVSSQGGINFFIGNNFDADGLTAQLPEPLGYNWRMKDVSWIAEQEVGHVLKPGEVSSFWTMKTVEWIQKNPTEFVTLYLKKLSYALSFQEVSNNRNLPIFFSKNLLLNYNPLGFGFIFVTCMLGLSFLKSLGSKERFLVHCLILYLLALALFFITSRFRLPLMAIMVLFSGYGLIKAKELIFTSRSQKIKTAGYVLLAIGLGFVSYLYLPSLPPATHFNSVGLHHYSEKNFEQAIESFRTGLTYDNILPELNLNLAAAFVKKGQLDSASLYLVREIKYNPGRAKAYAVLSSIRMLEGMNSIAVNLARQSIEIRPYDPFVNKVLIRALESDSLTTDSVLVEEAIAGISRTDYNLDYLLDAGLTLLSAGMLVEAEELFITALYAPAPPVEADDACFDHVYANSRHSRSLITAQAAFRLSYIYGRSGDLISAANSAHQAIEMDSTLTEAYVNLVSAYSTLGKMNSADSVLLIANELFPDNKLIKQLNQ